MKDTIILTQAQDEAFAQLRAFLDNSSDVFVLRGYAGTGKTTLLRQLVAELRRRRVLFALMAPTGRAAKVLKNATGSDASTIHRAIYSRKLECKEIDNPDSSKKTYRYVFPLVGKSDFVPQVVVVDEASMVSDVAARNEFCEFGSGRLLTDLLQYVRQLHVGKLIFVGDEAQLPPVGDARSQALDPDGLRARGFTVESAQLSEVVRQQAGSGILQTAVGLRDLLGLSKRERTTFCITPDGTDVRSVEAFDMVSRFCGLFPHPSVEASGVMVCYSNAQTARLNAACRERYFPGAADRPCEGDVLLVTHNNYNVAGCELYNGDMVTVGRVGGTETHENVPVTVEGERHRVSLRFRQVGLNVPGVKEVVSCFILDDLLFSPSRDYDIWQQKALYVDFCMRWRKRPAAPKEGSPEFADALQHDPYFNALRVKFGYAITCHKAQGGEWDTVFVDYEGRCGLSDDALRWCYTATTRARSVLYAVHAPHLTPLSKFEIKPVQRLSKAPADFFSPSLCPDCLPDEADLLPGVRLKLASLRRALAASPFQLVGMLHYNYLEKWDFRLPDGSPLRLEAHYDKAGTFSPLPLTDDGSLADKLRRLVNETFDLPQSCAYEASQSGMADFYQRLLSACVDEGVAVTNVVEHLDNYYVVFYLKTDARFALLQVYHKSGVLTAVMPKSEQGTADEKLNRILEKIK